MCQRWWYDQTIIVQWVSCSKRMVLRLPAAGEAESSMDFLMWLCSVETTEYRKTPGPALLPSTVLSSQS